MKKKMNMVVEMAQDLMTMETDAYMMCKYILLVVSRERSSMNHLIKVLFGLTDVYRPLSIEMKEVIRYICS